MRRCRNEETGDDFIAHADFKKKLPEAKLVVRTGEITPYSNIILVSGVQTLFAPGR